MHLRSRWFLWLAAFAALGAFVFALWPAPAAQAQCGSQASSCKNCHEVQGVMPVNDKGDWHTSHAFGDFCEFCHAGNVQAPEAELAHAGMVDPLADAQASCAACHPDDAGDLAQAYAAALGVTVGGGSAPSSSPPSAPAEGPAAEEAGVAMVVPAAEAELGVIDFNQRYDETVLGERAINWGNLILGVLIVIVIAAGAALIVWNERRLQAAEPSGAEKQPATSAESPPAIEGVSPEVAALLPALEKLNPIGRRALTRLLVDPETASDLLYRLSRLDPDLVRQVRGLDREIRSLLLAMSGD